MQWLLWCQKYYLLTCKEVSKRWTYLHFKNIIANVVENLINKYLHSLPSKLLDYPHSKCGCIHIVVCVTTVRFNSFWLGYFHQRTFLSMPRLCMRMVHWIPWSSYIWMAWMVNSPFKCRYQNWIKVD